MDSTLAPNTSFVPLPMHALTRLQPASPRVQPEGALLKAIAPVPLATADAEAPDDLREDGDALRRTDQAAYGRAAGAAQAGVVALRTESRQRDGVIIAAPAAIALPLPDQMEFDESVMRWVPLVVPMLGVLMVLLIGAIWTIS